MKKFKKRKGFKPVSSRNENSLNQAPSDFSVQEIPRSLKEFVKLKESTKNPDNDEKKLKSKFTSKLHQKSIPQSKIDEVIPLRKTIGTPQNQISYDSDSSEKRSSVGHRKNNQKRKKKLKLLKLQEKRKNKRAAELEKRDNLNEIVKDCIKFGEVVHRPPQISVLPRKVAQSGFQNRPGRKDDLLLKSLLKQKHLK